MNDETWYRETFIPTVRQARRGDHRGARALLGRLARPMRPSTTCATGSSGTNGKWVTMGIASDGSYGIPEGTIYGFPVTCAGGKYQIVKGLEIDDFQPRQDGRHAQGTAWKSATA